MNLSTLFGWIITMVGAVGMATFIWIGLSALGQLLLLYYKTTFEIKRGRNLATAVRKEWVQFLHKRPWDCWDEWEVVEDKYNSDAAQTFRKMTVMTGMKWRPDFWKNR